MKKEQSEKRSERLNPGRTLWVALTLLGVAVGAASLAGQTVSAGAGASTYVLQARATMTPGSAGGGTHGNSHYMPLPGSVGPVVGFNGLVVMDEGLRVVVAADLTSPSRLQCIWILDQNSQVVLSATVSPS